MHATELRAAALAGPTASCVSPLRSFVKGLQDSDMSKAQLGLAHSYSRAKVKFNVNKADNMIIQVGNLGFQKMALFLLWLLIAWLDGWSRPSWLACGRRTSLAAVVWRDAAVHSSASNRGQLEYWQQTQ